MFPRVQPLQIPVLVVSTNLPLLTGTLVVVFYLITSNLSGVCFLFYLLISTWPMDYRKYHDREEDPYESRRTSYHDHPRRERRNDDYHYSSARKRRRKGPHEYQEEFDMPASQPEKTGYVQTWLQRSKATRTRPPEPIPEESRPRKISPRAHMVNQASHKKKRTRSESPEHEQTHSPVVIRFEKRSRHKTRHDKYDYKPERDHTKRGGKGKEHHQDEESDGSFENPRGHKRSEHRYMVRICFIVI